MAAPFQPRRRAQFLADQMTRTLKRLARADDRFIYEVATDAGLSRKALENYDGSATPNLVTAMALADTLGYEIVLRRKAQPKGAPDGPKVPNA